VLLALVSAIPHRRRVVMEPGELFSIGEFSKITGLTVKTLRFYHEQNLLLPSCIDDQTGYRYYDAGKIEPARMIAHLRELEFPLPEIAEIFSNCRDESDILDYFQRHKKNLENDCTTAASTPDSRANDWPHAH
jgi:DNA-binding transcriptional MerR regulator